MRFARPGIVLLTLAALGLGGCVSQERPRAALAAPAPVNARYASLASEPFPVASVDASRIPERYLRHEVEFATAEPAGTIVIDTAARHLYYVQGNGRAIRYGVGVGKEGMSWSGVATVGNKRAWPDWYPPKEMIARRPDIESKLVALQSGRGLPGGPDSPLGARALYLHQDGKDTLYRIHGTLEPYTMGQAVSSGCVRMINQDAIDLFSRVDVGTRVVVLPDGPRQPAMAGADMRGEQYAEVDPVDEPRSYAGYAAPRGSSAWNDNPGRGYYGQ
jgi:lipoprotein-anchoring transpeptidase ErfK/SrfK